MSSIIRKIKYTIVLFLLIILVNPSTYAGFTGKENVIITGKYKRGKNPIVKLFSVTHGRLVELASYNVKADGDFGFNFRPEYEGFYVIGTGGEQNIQDKYKFYFRKGDQLNLEINDSSYTLVGKNTKENKALTLWHDMVFTLEYKSVYFMKNRSTYIDFFPALEEIAAKARQHKFGLTGNRSFDSEFAVIRELDLLAYAMEMVSTPRTAHPKAEDFTEFYRNINVGEITRDTRLLMYPFGSRVLGHLQRIRSVVSGRQPSHDLSARLDGVVNDTIKGEIVVNYANSLKTIVGYEDLAKNYGRYILTEDQQKRAKELFTKLAVEANKPGEPAINFTYPDAEGKMVSLSDFKGKVVLVDVWATWCGPCKAEIPSLKKMEEEFRDKDIVFLSVSVDEEKDRQKWKDFIAQEDLKGVQLFASGWSGIAKFCNITGIPRFMVFDKQGRIITINSPRPSNPELKLLLEQELKK